VRCRGARALDSYRWLDGRTRSFHPLGGTDPIDRSTRIVGAAARLYHCAFLKSSHTNLLTLCVNVSPLQIDEAFAAKIRLALELTGYPAKQLELEITEGQRLDSKTRIPLLY
jgi:EAL domain-containing protein (putative c-di-GMP-specific phosphodiesterase class I)